MLKRAGKSRDFKPRHQSNGKRPSSSESKKDIACFVCGFTGHHAACLDRVLPKKNG